MNHSNSGSFNGNPQVSFNGLVEAPAPPICLTPSMALPFAAWCLLALGKFATCSQFLFDAKWISMNFYGFLWVPWMISMDFYGFLWISHHASTELSLFHFFFSFFFVSSAEANTICPAQNWPTIVPTSPRIRPVWSPVPTDRSGGFGWDFEPKVRDEKVRF